MVKSIVQPWSNQWHHKYIIYMLLKHKTILIIKILNMNKKFKIITFIFYLSYYQN